MINSLRFFTFQDFLVSFYAGRVFRLSWSDINKGELARYIQYTVDSILYIDMYVSCYRYVRQLVAR